ncbi:MAG: small subunit ribosomal protein S6e [Archaeoglobi archaeon]|nr:30S ribosomal protein S6e [Candidatus Mnemosynella bozhongmuii]MDI3502418.1 small subunit ribosomal protein S6e [Archaeoglobi archaeon]MDK2781212.1 small subunit ribosomal protein S6e [Archaeoglobi archaeon]
MVEFKVVISDPKTGRAYQVEISEPQANVFIGKKIGETVEGDAIGLPGYVLEITGGSDKDGFPMRRDIPGAVRRRVLLSGPPGYHPKRKGARKRKTVVGNTISPSIVQINTKIVKRGRKKIETLLGLEAEEGEEEVKEEVAAES